MSLALGEERLLAHTGETTAPEIWGNNLIIKDGKLLLDQSKAFFFNSKGYDSVNLLAKKLEPNKEVITPIQMLRLEPICTSWRREGIRTPDDLTAMHALQACPVNHLGISPLWP